MSPEQRIGILQQPDDLLLLILVLTTVAPTGRAPAARHDRKRHLRHAQLRVDLAAAIVAGRRVSLLEQVDDGEKLVEGPHRQRAAARPRPDDHRQHHPEHECDNDQHEGKSRTQGDSGDQLLPAAGRRQQHPARVPRSRPGDARPDRAAHHNGKHGERQR
uniref:hypothetical protein n=1 Tax=Paractinoplanes polyasparticus TaxID=2856853 RepID=UPI001C847A67|nr:hypothetical protein [Actinoplanes polyasparticus]